MQALPISLATTLGISVDFFSSSYLDVSVHSVRHLRPMYSVWVTPCGAPTACTHTVSGSISLPSPGFFSPFPHGTGSLSVGREYLALEDGPPMFRQDYTCPALLVANLVSLLCFRVRGYHPLRPHFPERSTNRLVISCRLVPVRSPLLRESRLISVPPAT